MFWVLLPIFFEPFKAHFYICVKYLLTTEDKISLFLMAKGIATP